MARILKRGDVCWVDLKPVKGSEQAGIRPVVILSRNAFNRLSRTVIAVAITSQPPRSGFPLFLELTSVKMPKRSWVKISQIRLLAAERFGKKIGSISAEELDQIVEGLNEIIGDG